MSSSTVWRLTSDESPEEIESLTKIVREMEDVVEMEALEYWLHASSFVGRTVT